ncbi:hypothetical protein ES703_103590 [subsurface metagenome]
MTLEKDIQELTDLYKVGTNRLTPAEKKAVGLGIEAMKEVQEARLMDGKLGHTRLPGETEE